MQTKPTRCRIDTHTPSLFLFCTRESVNRRLSSDRTKMPRGSASLASTKKPESMLTHIMIVQYSTLPTYLSTGARPCKHPPANKQIHHARLPHGEHHHSYLALIRDRNTSSCLTGRRRRRRRAEYCTHNPPHPNHTCPKTKHPPPNTVPLQPAHTQKKKKLSI